MAQVGREKIVGPVYDIGTYKTHVNNLYPDRSARSVLSGGSVGRLVRSSRSVGLDQVNSVGSVGSVGEAGR